MKRELKFRVWDIDCHRWMERKWDKNRMPVWHHGDEHSPYVSLDWILKNERYWSVQQYTGLKDRNGTEIYEGDIIRYTPFNQRDYKNTIVEVLTLDKFHWFQDLEEMLSESNKCDVEVIGNIFENKDLLKK